MPFGLRNSPATFQRRMEVVLARQLECASLYIDDILISSMTRDEHQKHKEDELFAALTQAKLVGKGKFEISRTFSWEWKS